MRILSSFAVCVLMAGLPSALWAADRICPHYLLQYCVRNADDHRMTVATNPCLAKRRHLHILYPGRSGSPQRRNAAYDMSEIRALVAERVAARFPRWAVLPITPVKESGWNNRTFHLGDFAC